MKSFNDNSPFVEDWGNTLVELYIQENVRFGRDTTSGVRIKPTQPKFKKSTYPRVKKPPWINAINHLKGGGDIENIKKRFILSETIEKKLRDESEV